MKVVFVIESGRELTPVIAEEITVRTAACMYAYTHAHNNFIIILYSLMINLKITKSVNFVLKMNLVKNSSMPQHDQKYSDSLFRGVHGLMAKDASKTTLFNY